MAPKSLSLELWEEGQSGYLLLCIIKFFFRLSSCKWEDFTIENFTIERKIIFYFSQAHYLVQHIYVRLFFLVGRDVQVLLLWATGRCHFLACRPPQRNQRWELYFLHQTHSKGTFGKWQQWILWCCGPACSWYCGISNSNPLHWLRNAEPKSLKDKIVGWRHHLTNTGEKVYS